MAAAVSLQSPFAIPREHVHALEASPAFGVLRRYLAPNTTFCTAHAHSDPDTQQTWLLHRDMLHALIMPVVALYARASSLAAAALCSPRPEDLELAFSGEARGAFLCLQCFIADESDWCCTRGCPACVVTETLSTDSHIRLAIAASLLSTASGGEGEPDEAGCALPPLPHMLPALRDAVAQDPFWEGPDMWSYLVSRATQLSVGVQALIADCIDLASLVAGPETAVSAPTTRALTHPSAVLASAQPAEQKGARLRKSKLAKRQLRMKDEEAEMMRRVALQCWAQARMPKSLRGDVLGLGRNVRARSLTCP